MKCHWLRLRATAHPTEVPELVAAATQTLTGLDDDTFSSLLSLTPLETHHGAEQVLVEAEVTRAREIRGALDLLWTPAHSQVLLDELEARVDESGVLFMRFDKQRAARGEIRLLRTGDGIQVRLKPEVHPFRREAVLAALNEALSARIN